MIAPVPAAPPTARLDPLPAGMTRAEQHLALYLQRFSFALDRHRLRFPQAGSTPGSDEETDQRVRNITAEIAALDEYIAAIYPEPTLPIHRLRDRFGLDAPSLHLLVAAAASALDLTLARRIAGYCGRGQPEAGFLVDVLAARIDDERAYLAALRPTAAPLKWRLLKLGAAPDWAPETPTLHSLALVPSRIVDWLRGEVGFDVDRFERTAQLRTSAGANAAAADPIADALFHEHEGRRVPLVLAGPALAGKATAIVAAAATRDLPVLEVDLESVVETAQPAELLTDLGREAMLRGAVLLLRHGEVLVEKSPELRRAAASILDSGALWSAVTVRGGGCEPVRRIVGSQLLRLEMPGAREQLSLWERAFPPSVARAPEVDLRQIVERYHLAPGDIVEAAATAIAQARQREASSPVLLDDITAAVRARLRHRLGDVAELMTTTLTWDDVVLPATVQDRVIELVATVRDQAQVMDRWGFRRKVTYGRAVSALFSGPPGTGKTMVANLIAKELGLELFRVDLSRVVSKWVGETEKNLGRAFDEAKSSQAVLLFDEADALFAKRTDVKSSNDRYANLEVNYLLQRLESFEGIVLLTTNNQSSIDDAFRRRLRFRIDFPTPDLEDRAQLWRSLFPAEAPLAGDILFDELAARFEMSGGYIKNAVVRAAFIAAAERQPRITHALLVRAAQLEWEEMGRLGRS